jgi:hypothetical protein
MYKLMALVALCLSIPGTAKADDFLDVECSASKSELGISAVTIHKDGSVTAQGEVLPIELKSTGKWNPYEGGQLKLKGSSFLPPAEVAGSLKVNSDGAGEMSLEIEGDIHLFEVQCNFPT